LSFFRDFRDMFLEIESNGIQTTQECHFCGLCYDVRPANALLRPFFLFTIGLDITPQHTPGKKWHCKTTNTPLRCISLESLTEKYHERTKCEQLSTDYVYVSSCITGIDNLF
jgi:hypothetical protein